MSRLHRVNWFAWLLVVCWLSSPTNKSFGQGAPPQPPAPFDPEAEVLTRGPVHEAFAVPVAYDPIAEVVVAQQPPADIQELPPNIRPADPDAVWISGYWNWDEERNQFIWISGLWRVPPPDRQWVPGYWTQVEGGFRRVCGFWAPLDMIEIAYYPPPPASLEKGPNSPAPGPDYFWVPGQWVMHDERYLWQPGYWGRSVPDWSWVSATYNWSPGGYIYTSGYWDYPPMSRGLMFAPVYFQPAIYNRPNYVYSPRVILGLEQLLTYLFVRPQYGNYYFGDYYGGNFAQSGFYPWFAAGNVGRWYDPIYSYQNARYSLRDPNWASRYQQQFALLTANAAARPPRTFAEQIQWSLQNRNQGSLLFARSIDDALRDREFSQRMAQVAEADRDRYRRRLEEIRQFSQQRREVEQQAKAENNNIASAPPTQASPDATNQPKVVVRGPKLKLPRDLAQGPNAPGRRQPSANAGNVATQPGAAAAQSSVPAQPSAAPTTAAPTAAAPAATAVTTPVPMPQATVATTPAPMPQAVAPTPATMPNAAATTNAPPRVRPEPGRPRVQPGPGAQPVRPAPGADPNAGPTAGPRPQPMPQPNDRPNVGSGRPDNPGRTPSDRPPGIGSTPAAPPAVTPPPASVVPSAQPPAVAPPAESPATKPTPDAPRGNRPERVPPGQNPRAKNPDNNPGATPAPERTSPPGGSTPKKPERQSPPSTAAPAPMPSATTAAPVPTVSPTEPRGKKPKNK